MQFLTPSSDARKPSVFPTEHSSVRADHQSASGAADNGSEMCLIAPASIAEWIQEYRRIRRQTEILCRPLQEEDFNLQAMPEVSPPKWHLAHTTWFFEILWLQEFSPNYLEFNPAFTPLFNSYYQSLGQPFPRERRGLLSRPTLDEVVEYRHEIDKRVEKCMRDLPAAKRKAALQRLQLGLHHEQQHQELLLTDIKYNFSVNPLLPAYLADESLALSEAPHAPAKINWCEFPGGIVSIGVDAAGDADDIRFEGFCFDNETPRHREFLQPYAMADRPVNNGDFLKFIQDGGYHRSELWLSEGWARVQQQQWQAPLYWFAPGQRSTQLAGPRGRDHRWQVFTLYGLRPLNPNEPVCHISYYEADAFARWAGARLPTEAEWENAAAQHRFEGHFIDDGILHPRAPCPALEPPCQLFGDVWEWTASAYAPYPGYRACAGAVGEYNGKFMCSQMVLRGGSCASERSHLRVSYRNFFYPWDRWQFSGLRIARAL
jgi:ergothioneine biosynthesis protein EgtB